MVRNANQGQSNGPRASVAAIHQRVLKVYHEVNGTIAEAKAQEALEEACLELWQQAGDNPGKVEAILYLWEQWYEQPLSDGEGSTGSRFGPSGFVYCIAAIMAATHDAHDREALIGGAIRFLTRHEPDLEDRFNQIAILAAQLTEANDSAGDTLARWLENILPPELLNNRFIAPNIAAAKRA